MRYYLYKKSYTESCVGADSDFLSLCTIRALSPTPLKYKIDTEKINYKTLLVRLYFWFITAGKFKIYYLIYNNDIVHTSYAVSECSKFTFMNKGDLEIGPCATASDYRRRGSYHYMLNYITSLQDYRNADFYMIVRETNEVSFNGVEKSGFVRIGTVRKSRILKKYILEKENG